MQRRITVAGKQQPCLCLRKPRGNAFKNMCSKVATLDSWQERCISLTYAKSLSSRPVSL
jgi:hypothetical protein